MRTALLFVLNMVFLTFAACDAELLEPRGYSRRLVRELDFEGMVRTEYRYLKNDRVGKIITYLRTETGSNPAQAGEKTVIQGNPYIYEFEYDGNQPVRAVVERSPVCGCGLPFDEIWTYSGSLSNNCQIQVETWFSGTSPDSKWQTSYRVEWQVSERKMMIHTEYEGISDAYYEFIFDELLKNVLIQRYYTGSQIVSEKSYSYDDKINPFYQLNHINILSPVYWSQNNIKAANDKTTPQYTQYLYTYYDLYPLSYRYWILNSDSESDWVVLYEYE